jgi:outer membrane protein assembly factor BamB
VLFNKWFCLRLSCVALLCGSVSNSQAADWPRFRGPSGDGISSDLSVPTLWSDSQNLKWKLELPGKGFSSPIVVGDYVFVTYYDQGDRRAAGLTRHLLCVDRNQGNIVWSKSVISEVAVPDGPSFGTRHGQASHTPVSDGERIFVLFGSSGVIAFDLTGRQLWRANVGREHASMFGSASSPILYGDALIVTAGSESESVVALNKLTGEELWKSEGASLSRCYSTPMVVTNPQGADELILSVPYEVWSLNPANGKLKWYAENDVDTNSCPAAVSQDGVVYIIGGRSGGRIAVRTGGKGDVGDSNVLWSHRGGSYVPSPVLHNGHLYWVNDSGIAYCVDADSGEEVSRKRLGGQFYASAVLVGDKLYVVSRFGGTYILEATPELTQVAHNTLEDDSDFSASPAVSDGQLILRSDANLYCIQTE